MSILPASRLSASDLNRLGNNLVPSRRPRPWIDREPRRVLAAVNRSLAGVGERIDSLSDSASCVSR